MLFKEYGEDKKMPKQEEKDKIVRKDCYDHDETEEEGEEENKKY